MCSSCLQFFLCWLTGGRLPVDCRSTAGRESLIQWVFDRQSVDSRSRFSTERRSSVGQVSVVRRPTRDRRLTNARPTSVVRRPTAHRCHLYDTWSDKAWMSLTFSFPLLESFIFSLLEVFLSLLSGRWPEKGWEISVRDGSSRLSYLLLISGDFAPIVYRLE